MNRDDAAMMKSPERWPRWPMLPLKHRTDRVACGFPRTGMLFATGKAIVFECNLFDFGPDFTMEGVPRHEYPSIEAIADEWEVD